MSTPPERGDQPGDRNFRNTVVRLADLTVTTVVVENYTFENCRILGPAVVGLRGCTITSCSWDAPGIDGLFWPVDPSRGQVVGAIMLLDCVFSKCAFVAIGVAGPPELRAELEKGISFE